MTPTHKIAVRSSTHLANIEYSRNAYCYSPTLLLERAQVLCGHSESLSKLLGLFFLSHPCYNSLLLAMPSPFLVPCHLSGSSSQRGLPSTPRQSLGLVSNSDSGLSLPSSLTPWVQVWVRPGFPLFPWKTLILSNKGNVNRCLYLQHMSQLFAGRHTDSVLVSETIAWFLLWR